MNLVVLSGAGISAESGIRTFRDSDGLWNEYKIEDVCTASAWGKNPTLVNDFYNMRRIDVLNAQPNLAHYALAELPEDVNINIITTNVDDLHERAGSTNVLHIHGNILKARSSNPNYDWVGMSPDSRFTSYTTYDVGRKGITMNDMAPDGFPLRPDIVFFGESVPKLDNAVDIISKADVLLVIGTSLQVYPAASLIYNIKSTCKCFYIDPSTDGNIDGFTHIKEVATKGVPLVLSMLFNKNL